MYRILLSLNKFKSIWELMYNIPINISDKKELNWVMIIENLIPLFRKDTFIKLIGKNKYYPQETENCRYYIKPNDGSCGRDIKIVDKLPPIIEGYTICPEIITPLILKKYKYDYRVWIGIQSNLEYFVCPTIIQRISTIPFNLNSTNGSLTNTALYSDQCDYQNVELYIKIIDIVSDVLKHLDVGSDKNLMLTGWDFIENESG